MEAVDNVMIVFVTVILQLASPPATFPVIVQVPAFFAVTLPYVFTEATALLLLLNRTHLPLLAIPARVKESPIFNVARYRERITRAGEAASAVKGAEKTEAVNSTAVHKRAMLRRQAAFKKIDVCFMINPPFVEQ